MVQVIEKAPSFSEQLGGALGRGLSAGLQGALEARAERKKQDQISEYFSKLAEQNPKDPLYQKMRDVFSAPGMSFQEKSAVARALMSGGDPFRQQQQARLEQESTLRKYNSRIREIDNELKFSIGNAERSRQLRDLKEALQRERDEMLEFPSLGQGEHEDLGLESSSRDTQDMFEDEDDEDLIVRRPKNKPPLKKAKPKFDSTNPEHRKRRDLVLRKTGGDRQKAGIVLSKEFEL